MPPKTIIDQVAERLLDEAIREDLDKIFGDSALPARASQSPSHTMPACDAGYTEWELENTFENAAHDRDHSHLLERVDHIYLRQPTIHPDEHAEKDFGPRL